MRCPACGALYKERSVRCPECGALQPEIPVECSQETQAKLQTVEETTPQVRRPTPKRSVTTRTTPSLIAFPGGNRSSLPPWRKELVERVREVQERRAREAVLEAGGSEPLFSELEAKHAPVLELISQAEAPPLNPLVVAALRRIERAHAHPAGNAAYATAVAYDVRPELGLDLIPADEQNEVPEVKPERVHNLAVVPTPPLPQTEIAATTADESEKPMSSSEAPQPVTRPRRLIDDRNDPALNYLDSIPTSVTLEHREYRAAPIYLRLLSAIADLVIAGLFTSPFLALTGLTNLEWRNPRVIGFAVGAFMVVGFLYLTVSIAFTGRTLGMKLFSLRVVDARTGLIPTGGQSAGRAFVYMLSLASAGLALLYAFVDSEKYTAHDRVTRTAVIRV